MKLNKMLKELIRKVIFKYIFFQLATFICLHVNAQKNGNYGTEISYKDLGNDSFLVTVVSYTDCDLCSYGQCGVKSIALRGPAGCSGGVTVYLKQIKTTQYLKKLIKLKSAVCKPKAQNQS